MANVAVIQKHEWDNKVLLFDNNTYFLPVKSKLLLKGIKNFDIQSSTGTILFTLLVWINLKGVPKEIEDRLMEKGVIYRVGMNPEKTFT